MFRQKLLFPELFPVEGAGMLLGVTALCSEVLYREVVLHCFFVVFENVFDFPGHLNLPGQEKHAKFSCVREKRGNSPE